METFLVAFSVPAGLLFFAKWIYDNRKGKNGTLKLQNNDSAMLVYSAKEQDFFFFRRVSITRKPRALKICKAEFPMLTPSLKSQVRTHTFWSTVPVELTIVKYSNETELQAQLLAFSTARLETWGNNPVAAMNDLNDFIKGFSTTSPLSGVK